MRVEFERRALDLFDRMLDRPPEEREDWLQQAAGGDTTLMLAVIALVAADRQSDSLPTLPPDAAPPAEPAPPPERLGKYRVVRELGRGGMGVVYLGERADGLFDQQVALKLIRQHVAGRAAATFETERRVLARIEHPNVARLIDGGVAVDGRPWLATEYVRGVTIDAESADRPLAANLRLFLQAAHAVQFAHGRLIAHGDVKPANILVGEEERVKLLDFGLARLTGAEGGHGPGPFTPGFASPERLAGAPPSVADDVFALGRTLAAVTDAQPDREVRAIVARATAPEPLRYRSAQALAGDIENWLARRPVAAMGMGGAYRARKFVARHRIGVAASLMALAGLSGTALVAQANYRRAEQARRAEALRFADAHRTAHYLMFTLLDRLERQPGTLRLRTQVAGVAQVYLDRLAASPDAPRDVQLDVARGYLRAAATAGMGNAPNLGDVDGAIRDLTQAGRMLDILRRDQPGWPDLAVPVGRRYSLLCQNQIYGGGHDPGRALAAARAGLAALATMQVDARTLADATWQVHICAGDALVWLNHADAAVVLLERSLAAGRARRPLDSYMLERNLRILGEAYYYANRFGDAERVLREAAAIQAETHRRQPFYGAAVIEAANVADDLASTYAEQHRYADQFRVADAALRLVQAQAALDKDDVQSLRRGLSITRLVAGALVHLGRAQEAAAHMKRADDGWNALVRRFPDDVATARLRLLALAVTGDLQRQAGDRRRACATYADTAQAWAAFGRRWQLSPSDARENVAAVARNLAACREGRASTAT